MVSTRMQMQYDLSEESKLVLLSHMSPTTESTSSQGWEECVNAAMMHLLRTVLAQSAKDSASTVRALNFPHSTSKLRKHITIVLKRIKTGGALRLGNINTDSL